MLVVVVVLVIVLWVIGSITGGSDEGDSNGGGNGVSDDWRWNQQQDVIKRCTDGEYRIGALTREDRDHIYDVVLPDRDSESSIRIALTVACWDLGY